MARTTAQWLSEYGESHQNPVNKRIHWICVPLIVLSLVGLLWSIPRPGLTSQWPVIANWATLFLTASVIYYLFLSRPLAFGMLIFALALTAATWGLDQLGPPLWAVSVAIFVLAWVGQFVGHQIEGKKPSFFKDLQFLMIGPLWLLAHLYERLGLRY